MNSTKEQSLVLNKITDREGKNRDIVLFNLHGGHSTALGDDGNNTPSHMMRAAHKMGVIAIGMGHNTLAIEYAETAKQLGMVPLVGFEGRFNNDARLGVDGEFIVVQKEGGEELTKKLHHIAEDWRGKFLANRKIQAIEFWNFLKGNLSSEEMNLLGFVQPHPDLTSRMPFFVKPILPPTLGATNITEQHLRFIPEMNQRTNAFEVYNGQSGQSANKRMAEVIGDNYPGRPTVANPDSHDVLDIGTAVNIAGVVPSEDGKIYPCQIFDALKDGYVIPVAGFTPADGNWPLYRGQIIQKLIKRGNKPWQKILRRSIQNYRAPNAIESARKMAKISPQQIHLLFDRHNKNKAGWMYQGNRLEPIKRFEVS